MYTRTFPLLLLSIAFMGNGALADSSNCTTQTVHACGVGTGSNENTTLSLKEAEARARNAMDKGILRQCETACRERNKPEEGVCVALRPTLSKTFSEAVTRQISGPDKDPDGKAVDRKIEIDKNSKNPRIGKINVVPPNHLEDPANTAASACAEVECKCRLNMN